MRRSHFFDAGTVVGTSTVGGDTASLWDSTKGIQYLGNLSGVYGSIARDINNLGQVVGSTIFPPYALPQIPKSIPEPTSELGLLGGILGSIYLLKRSASIKHN